MTVTFPAVPEYLRLARIATADAASRAGLDYEEIDDVRIAVSELCSLVSLDPEATRHPGVPGRPPVADRRGRVAHRARRRSAGNELSEAIIAAVADEHSLEHRRRRHPLPGHASAPATFGRLTERVRTRRRRLSGDWSLRRPGREGPAPSSIPGLRSASNLRIRVPEKIFRATTTVGRCCSGGGSCCSSSPSWRGSWSSERSRCVAIRDRDDAQQRERQLSVAVERVAQLGTAYADQETGERGYVITGETGVPGALHERPRSPPSGSSHELRSRTLDTADAAPRPRGDHRSDGRPGAAKPPSPRSQLRDRATPNGGRAGRQRHGQGPLRRRARRRRRDSPTGSRPRRTGPRSTSTTSARRLTSLFVGRRSWSRSWVRSSPAGSSAAGSRARSTHLADEVRRVRAGALDSPIRITGPPGARVARPRHRRHARSHPPAAGRVGAVTRRPSSRARRSCSRCAPSSNPTSGRSPTDGPSPVALRAAEGVVAGDCYDLFVTRERRHRARSSSTSPGTAPPRASSRCGARRCSAPRSRRAPRPGDALDTTAEILGDMGDEVFLTAFVAVIDTDDGRVRYANAGHPPAYVVRRPATPTPLEPTGPLVGLLAPGLGDRRGGDRSPATTSVPTPTGSSRPATPTTSSSVPSAWSSCCRGRAATRRRRS